MGYRILPDSKQTGAPEGKKRYIFDVSYLGKRHRHEQTCPPSAVKSLYRAWEKQVINGELEMNFTLFEKLDEYLKHVRGIKSPRAVSKAELAVRRFKDSFKNMRLKEFRRYHVEEYIAKRKKLDLADSTINREIAELSVFFTWAITRDYYTRNNPCFKTKLKVNVEREIYLSPEQVEELLTKARDQGKIFTAVLIALTTGLRRNEIFNLSWSDVDFRHSRLFIRSAYSKGKKTRTVAMPQVLFLHLEGVKTAEGDHERIFWDWKTDNTLRSQWEKLRSSLSFLPFTDGDTLHFHDLRHVYAQTLRDAGVDLSDISAFLGHSSISITQKFYAQAGGYDAQKKVEKLGDVIPIFRQKTG